MCNRTSGGDDSLFGGDRPCIQQRRKFLHKKTSSYPPKSILQGRSKGWSKMKLKRPPSISSSINFPLKKSIHKILWKIWHVFSYKKNKNTIFKGSSSSAPGRCVLWRCCFRYISTSNLWDVWSELTGRCYFCWCAMPGIMKSLKLPSLQTIISPWKWAIPKGK